MQIVFGTDSVSFASDMLNALSNQLTEMNADITTYNSLPNKKMDAIKKALKQCQGFYSMDEVFIMEKEFDTEKECAAYLEGITDAEGWMDYYKMSDDDKPKWEIIKGIIK